MIRPSRFQWGLLAALFLHVSGMVSIAGTLAAARPGPSDGRLAPYAPLDGGDPRALSTDLELSLFIDPAGDLQAAGTAGGESDPGHGSSARVLPVGALASNAATERSSAPGSSDALETMYGGREANDRSPSAESSPESSGQREPRRRLSLEELGVAGDGRRWSGLRPRSRAPGPRRAGQQPGPSGRHGVALARQLEHSLKQGQVAHDRRVGLGAGGPVVSALQQITRRSDVPARSHAQFLVVTDAAGRATGVTLLGASGKTRAWNAVARQLLRSLQKQRLRVAAGARGVAVKLEVRSRPQLPSGADPGVAVDVLGLPLKKGTGKKSTRLSVFPPVLTGDLSDIGANEIRMVSARVLSEQVL